MHEEQFGPYRLEALLGRGGMGEVFRAFDTEHERVVAVKRLAPHLADDPEFRGRFKQEARLAARLRNPHIITIHRFGELDGRLFIDMRFVSGFDAADLVNAVGPLAPRRAVALVEQVASALDTAHAAGLVHRDVKPSNVLIDREISEQFGDFAYLADFGITRASSTTRSYSLTRTGALLGSLDYMAPEQFEGVVDKRADIYALACVLFELLTGRKPYDISGLPALMHAHLNVSPPVPSQIRPEVGSAFDAVISRGMAKRREERFDSAGELAAAAREALAPACLVEGADEPATDRQAERSFREAEYAYVVHRKQRERGDSVGRHVLGDDEPDTGQRAAPALPEPAQDEVELPSPDEITAPLTDRADDDAETHSSGSTGATVVGEGPTQPTRPTEANEEETESTPDAREPEARAHERERQASASALDAGADTDSHPSPAIMEKDDGDSAVPSTPEARAAWQRVVLPALAVVAVLAVVIGIVLYQTDGGPDEGTSQVGTDASAPVPPAPSPASAAPPVPASTATPVVEAVVPIGEAPQGLAVTPDSRLLVVANIGSRTLAIVERGSAAPATTLQMPGTPRYVALSPDGSRAYVSMYSTDGADSAVAVVDVASGTISAVVPSGPQPYALAAAPSGDVYVPNHGSASVSVLDGETVHFGASVAVEPNPHGVVFSPSGQRAYTANHESNSVSVIDLRSTAIVATIDVGASPHSVAVSPDGRLLAVANYQDASISLVDTSMNLVTATIPAGPTPQHLTFSADGVHLYVVNEGADALSTIDLAAREVVASTPVGRSPRFVVAAPDGTTLYVSNSDDGTVSVLGVS